MKKLYQFLAIGLLGVCAASCSSDDDANITPADITGLRSESGAGRIVLRWNKLTAEEASTVKYVQVNYYDHRSKMDNKRLASVFADSIEIPDTRERYGEYEFTVKTVSPSGAFGTEEVVTGKSGKATATYIKKAIQLSAEDLFSNCPEPNEGPIGDCVDGDINTFFHTSWSTYLTGPHYLEVDLKQTISSFYAFQYATRHNNASDAPWEIELQGNNGGDDWFTLCEYSNENGETVLPVNKAESFESEMLKTTKPFNKVRFIVWSTAKYPGPDYHGQYWGPWWAISEFKFYNVDVIDPEDPAQDGVED